MRVALPRRANRGAASLRSQGNTHEAQRKQLLRELEEKLSRTEARAEQYERKHHAATEAMGTLRQGIQTMFDKLGCDSGANRELLGEGGVTDGNMMQYLGVIEQRINEILASYAATQGLDATGTNLAALLGAGGSGGETWRRARRRGRGCLGRFG